MRLLLVSFSMLISSPLMAGDYMLYVGASTEECKNVAVHVAPCNESSFHVCSAEKVSEDLRLFFSGRNPQVQALAASFTNGHVKFCSSDAKHIVSKALHEIEASGKSKKGRQLSDFIHVNGL